MVKVWFSVPIYQIFKAFMEAMKYTLFGVTITGFNCYTNFCFLKFDQGLNKSGKKCKKQLQFVIFFRSFRSDDYGVGLSFCSFCFVFSFL